MFRLWRESNQQQVNNPNPRQHPSSLWPQALVWHSHHIEIIRRLSFLHQHVSNLMNCHIAWQQGCVCG